MNWSRKKENFLNIFHTYLRYFNFNRKNKNSLHIQIPIYVTQVSTQTLEKYFSNNNNNNHHHVDDSKSYVSNRRKYQHRFNKCLAELIEKYPPIPAYEDFKENNYSNEIHLYICSKLLENRENLIKLNQILEDLDKQLEYLYD